MICRRGALDPSRGLGMTRMGVDWDDGVAVLMGVSHPPLILRVPQYERPQPLQYRLYRGVVEVEGIDGSRRQGTDDFLSPLRSPNPRAPRSDDGEGDACVSVGLYAVFAFVRGADDG